MGAGLEARHRQKMDDDINQTERLACRIDTNRTEIWVCKTASSSHKVDIRQIGTWTCKTHHFLCQAHLHQTLDSPHRPPEVLAARKEMANPGPVENGGIEMGEQRQDS